MLPWLRQTIARIRAFFGARDLDRDFDQEMESHLTMLTEDYARRGMTREEARGEACRRFGGITQLREAHRETRGLPLLESFRQDLQFAVRAFRKNPGFTAIAVLTLGVGIGVNTAVFTAYNAVALRPIQATEPSRFVQITNSTGSERFSYPDYVYYRDNNRTFSGLIAITYGGRTFAMTGVGAPAPATPGGIASAVGFRSPRALTEHAGTVGVSGNYFKVLGLGAALGRTFLPQEDVAGAQPVAVVSDKFWERRFARDPGLLGQSLTLNGVSVTIIGITARDFSGTSTFVPDLWLPLALHCRLTGGGDLSYDRNADNYKVYGRLGTGVAQRMAEAEINSLATQLQLAFPGADRRPGSPTDRFRLTQASLSGPTDFRATTKVILILGAVGSVLLIACANVASLLLARSAARQREIAIRLAIGASRGRLIRQLLTENAVMSVFAGAMGVIFSWWSLHYLMAEVAASFPSYVTMALRLAPDQRVLAYMLFLSLASTVAFGLAPALEASKPNLSSALKDEGAAFGGTLRKPGLRDLMVGTQVAVCLVLLIAAGLLARSSQRAFAVDLGFDYRGIVFLDVSYPRTETPAKIATARTQLAQQLEHLPEIQSLAVASMLPLKGNNLVVAVAPNGGALNDPGTPNSLVNLVTPSYFDTMGIPILRGRNFTAQESRDGSNFDGSAVIVSESTARRFWPGEEALGKRIALGPCRGCRRLSAGEEYPHSASSLVIGVAKDVRRSLDRADEGTESSSRLLYLPATRASWGWTVMRVRGDEGKAVTAIEREFRATKGGMEAVVWDSRTAFADQNGFVISRVGAIGCAIIGVLGLLMTSVGIYGTVGFAVAQRTQEIGVRMALGAQRGDVLRLVLSQTMRPIALGLAVGFLGASMVSRLMSGFLFGLSVLDPVTFLGVSGFLATVALIAGYMPARKATWVDPMIALRYE